MFEPGPDWEGCEGAVGVPGVVPPLFHGGHWLVGGGGIHKER
ncbi:hypothetical protein [Leptospira borgpetersenii]|nr:hypothetical protein [Leptospira borgpetersenii]